MHGVLLTGGRSSRMGTHKAAIDFGGRTFAQRAADALRAVAEPVVAAGPSFDTGLESVEDPDEGPLVAFVCGAGALPMTEPVFLVACDVPFVTAEMLRVVASSLGDFDAVVPVAFRDIDTPEDLARARALLSERRTGIAG
jgi:molybdopterin-guanine dinucleotide biosynthesis protein A